MLIGDGVISDVYQKESKGRTMTFICSETKWTGGVHGRAGRHGAV